MGYGKGSNSIMGGWGSLYNRRMFRSLNYHIKSNEWENVTIMYIQDILVIKNRVS